MLEPRLYNYGPKPIGRASSHLALRSPECRADADEPVAPLKNLVDEIRNITCRQCEARGRADTTRIVSRVQDRQASPRLMRPITKATSLEDRGRYSRKSHAVRLLNGACAGETNITL